METDHNEQLTNPWYLKVS